MQLLMVKPLQNLKLVCRLFSRYRCILTAILLVLSCRGSSDQKFALCTPRVLTLSNFGILFFRNDIVFTAFLDKHNCNYLMTRKNENRGHKQLSEVFVFTGMEMAVLLKYQSGSTPKMQWRTYFDTFNNNSGSK